MKRRIAIAGLLFALLPAGTALADADIGCGWGTMALEGKEGSFWRSLGATTNGFLFNQTLGISFATAKCENAGPITADTRSRMFASANFDRLARDMAHGHGETLEAFALLMGIAEEDRPAFYAFTKAHFVDLYDGDEVTSDQMVTELRALMAEDTALSSYAEI